MDSLYRLRYLLVSVQWDQLNWLLQVDSLNSYDVYSEIWTDLDFWCHFNGIRWLLGSSVGGRGIARLNQCTDSDSIIKVKRNGRKGKSWNVRKRRKKNVSKSLNNTA